MNMIKKFSLGMIAFQALLESGNGMQTLMSAQKHYGSLVNRSLMGRNSFLQNRNFFQPAFVGIRNPKQNKTWKKPFLGARTFAALCQPPKYDIVSQTGTSETLFEKIFYNPNETDEIKNFLDANTSVTKMAFIYDAGCFFKTLDFNVLNDYPQVKNLRIFIHESNNRYRSAIDLSPLKYIQHFDDSIDKKFLTLFPTESLISLRTHSDKIYSINNCNKLQKLDLSDSGISDLKNVRDMSPIGFLHNLEYLSLNGLYPDAGNWLFLQKLQNLKNLTVKYNSNFNIESIDGLNLESLKIWSCHKSTNLEVISTLNNLKTLSLGNLANNSLIPLRKNKSLENVKLNFAHNIDSLDALRDLPLKRLILTFGQVKDLAPIATLTGLETLDISGNYPSYWDGLINHPSLKQIRVLKNDIKCPHKMLPQESLHVPLSNLGAYIAEFEKKMLLRDDWYPLKVLKTIPNLKHISMVPTEIDPDVLAKFKAERPDIEIADRGSF